ncbi:MAG TPA: glycosyltransferase family 2 protein [Thermoanaerobaculia bacterium]|nr:glycosyltransferase family 2 protein [Thermoanaerobaculia bacterium]
MKLIIQIPAYNEEKTIEATLAALPKKVPGIAKVETLVIDDGSSDRTVEAARRAGADHLVRLVSHRGLSRAFLAGIDASLRLGADVIVNTDADNQYRASDLPKLVAPILDGSAEVVIGDRDIRSSPHMGPVKKLLQRLGSWAVGRAAGLRLPDVTSGFRAFSREAAYQINVFNPFTYTLETIIQAGNRNLGVRSVTIGTNPPTRPSRLYRGAFGYVRKSIVTIFRIYTLYKPLKTFFAIGSILFLAGFALGLRFLWFWMTEGSAGHVQSLILASVLLIIGFQTALIGLVADLISVNRRLSEEVLVRLRKLDPRIAEGRKEGRRRDREGRRDEPRSGRPREAPTQWVWLLDESKFEGTLEEPEGSPAHKAPPPEQSPAGTSRKRRRRRRSGPRPGQDVHDRRHHHPRIGREEESETPAAEGLDPSRKDDLL